MAIVASIIVLSRPPFYSPADEVRPWTSQYDDLIGPLVPMPPPNPPLLSPSTSRPFQRTDGTDEVTFTSEFLDNQTWSYNPPARVSPNAKMELPLNNSKTVPLVAIYSSYPTGPDTRESGFFSPVTLDRLEPSDLPKNIASHRGSGVPTDFGEDFPTVFLLWDIRQAERFNTLSISYFDSRTHCSLRGNSGYSLSGNGFDSMGTTIYRYHDGPFTVVVDYVEEEWESGSFSLEPEATLQLPKSGLEAKVLQIESVPELAGSVTTRTERDPASGKMVGIKSFSTKPGTGTQSTLVFLSITPTREKVSRTYKAKLKNGETSYISSSWSDERLHILKLKVAPEEVAEIEVSLSNPQKRAVFEFPRFPGTPPENDGLNNLFDIQIPYIDLDGERPWKTSQWIANSAHIRFHETARPKDGHLYQGGYENLSMIELLDLQRKLGGPTTPLALDRKTYELGKPESRLLDWWNGVKKRFPWIP